MKVYSISKWAFLGICILILTLPLSRHWKLFILGESSTGVVTEFAMIVHENIAGERLIQHVSKIQFKALDSIYFAHGPPGYEYENGRKIRLMYDPDDPTEYCLLTFSGIYLNNYVILPLVLITVWLAFYLSYNSYSRKKRTRHAKDIAFSPYNPRKKAKASSWKQGETVSEVQLRFKENGEK